MKFSLNILTLCLSVATAVGNECLDADRSNLASVCRNECAQEGAIAFSVSRDEIWCRCYPDIDELGTYTGNDGDQNSRMTCYSMADGEETKVLGHGHCIIDNSTGSYGTKHTLEKCEDDGEENQENCLVKGRDNLEKVCQKECLKHRSVAFSISNDDDICRCYPYIVNDEYTGSAELDPDSPLTCYVMEGENTEKLGYYDGVMDGENITYTPTSGDCVPFNIYMSRGIIEHNMKTCPKVEKLLRGSVSA